MTGVYRGEATSAHISDAQGWSALEPAVRLRRAEDACQRRDVEALWSLTEAYLEEQTGSRSGLSDHTRRAYRQSIQALVSRWSGDLLLHPSPDAAAALVRDLAASGLSAATLRVRISGARALFRALQWAGAAPADPFAGVRPPADAGRPPRTREPYDEGEYVALLAAADPVDRAMILLCRTGLSMLQCVSLTWAEVDLEGGRLLVEAGGGRQVPIDGELRRTLSTLPRGQRGNVLGFGSEARARQRLQDLCRRADVPYRGAQALRGATQGTNDSTSSAGQGFLSLPALRDELRRAAALAQRSGGVSGVILVEVRPGGSEDEGTAQTADGVFEAVLGRARRVIRQYDLLAPGPGHRLYLGLINLPSRDVLASVVHRFWSAVPSRPVAVGRGQEVPVTVTIGAAAGREGPDALLREAEEALRRASGRGEEGFPGPLRTVRAWLEAFNRGDRGAFAAVLAGDARLTDLRTGRSRWGRRPVSVHVWGWRRALPGLHAEIVNAAVAGERVFLQMVWTAQQPSRDGRSDWSVAAIPGYAAITLRGDRVRTLAYYVDPSVEIAQLSVLPGT